MTKDEYAKRKKAKSAAQKYKESKWWKLQVNTWVLIHLYQHLQV
jgi:hypothetical protein